VSTTTSELTSERGVSYDYRRPVNYNRKEFRQMLEDLFPNSIKEEKIHDDIGSCWTWTKPEYRVKRVQIHRMIANMLGSISKDTLVWRICLNDRCIHPEHLTRSLPGEQPWISNDWGTYYKRKAAWEKHKRKKSFKVVKDSNVEELYYGFRKAMDKND